VPFSFEMDAYDPSLCRLIASESIDSSSPKSHELKYEIHYQNHPLVSFSQSFVVLLCDVCHINI
jgi:hypothetical protein